MHIVVVAQNNSASIPTLYTQGRVLTSTTEIISHLVAIKGKQPSVDRAWIDKVHEDGLDPNFCLLLARNKDELQAKAAGVPGEFVRNRQESLLKHFVSPAAASFKPFYSSKIASNGAVLAIYNSSAPQSTTEDFFRQSQEHVARVQQFILTDLAQHLSAAKGSAFLGGEIPGEEDFHVGAWLARIAMTSGAHKSEEGIQKLQEAMGKPVPGSVKAYWERWSARSSWKEVYLATLH